MKKSITLILLLTLFHPAFSQWSRKSNMPVFRYNPAFFVINDTGYVTTGFNQEMWQYIAAEDKWINCDSFPGPSRSGAISFSIGGKGYVGGGDTGDIHPPPPRNDFWEYDPVINKWTKKADLPVMTVNGGSLFGFSINGMGYLYDAAHEKFHQYDPEADQWIGKATLQADGMIFVTGFALNNKAYMGIGFSSTKGKDWYMYDPVMDQWTRKADFPGTPRNDAVSFSIGNYGYVGMGIGSGDFQKDFWRYDPKHDKWTQIDSTGYASAGAFSFVINNKAYIGGGIFLEEPYFYEYNPIIVSVKELPENKKLNVYPNPVKNVLHLQSEITDYQEIHFFDLQGKLVKSIINQNHVDLSDLSDGVYILKAVLGNERVNLKIVKY